MKDLHIHVDHHFDSWFKYIFMNGSRKLDMILYFKFFQLEMADSVAVKRNHSSASTWNIFLDSRKGNSVSASSEELTKTSCH